MPIFHCDSKNDTLHTNRLYPQPPVLGVCFNDGKMTIAVFTKAILLFTQVDAICTSTMLTPFLPTTFNGGIIGVCSPLSNNLENTLRKLHLKCGGNAQRIGK